MNKLDEYIEDLRNELEDSSEYFNFDEIYNDEKYICLEPRRDIKKIDLEFIENKFVFNYPFAYYYVDIKFFNENINIDCFDLIKIGKISVYNLILDFSFYSKNKIKINNNQLIYLNNNDFCLEIYELYKDNPVIETIKIYLPKNHNLLYYGAFYLKEKETIKLAENIEQKHKIKKYIFDYNKYFKYSKYPIKDFIMKINNNNYFDSIEYITISYTKIIYSNELDFYTSFHNFNYNIEWQLILCNKLNIKFFDFYKIPILDEFCERIDVKLFNSFNEDITKLFKINFFIVNDYLTY